jgi:hypothetical protein
VFSKTPEQVVGNARLVRDNLAGVVSRLKEEPGNDLSVGGAGACEAQANEMLWLPLIRPFGS